MNPWLHWEHVWRVQADRDGEIVWGITDTRVNTTANLEIVSDIKMKKEITSTCTVTLLMFVRRRLFLSRTGLKALIEGTPGGCAAPSTQLDLSVLKIAIE